MIFGQFYKTRSKNKFRKSAGFTMTELVVVLAILGIIFGILVTRQSSFQSRFRVDDKVYDVVINLRKAQAYTFGVREHDCSGTKSFPSYGILLTTTNLSDRDRFLFFADKNGNGLYDNPESGASSCYTETIILGNPSIDRICGYNNSNSQVCWPGSGALRQVSVVFHRPDPRPVFAFMNQAGTNLPINPPLEIYFKYPSQISGEAKILVEHTGQVSVSYVP